jgi:hypothetical protein
MNWSFASFHATQKAHHSQKLQRWHCFLRQGTSKKWQPFQALSTMVLYIYIALIHRHVYHTCYSYVLHINRTTAYFGLWGAWIGLVKTQIWFFGPLVLAQLLKRKNKNPFARQVSLSIQCGTVACKHSSFCNNLMFFGCFLQVMYFSLLTIPNTFW